MPPDIAVCRLATLAQFGEEHAVPLRRSAEVVRSQRDAASNLTPHTVACLLRSGLFEYTTEALLRTDLRVNMWERRPAAKAGRSQSGGVAPHSLRKH